VVAALVALLRLRSATVWWGIALVLALAVAFPLGSASTFWATPSTGCARCRPRAWASPTRSACSSARWI
jgi:hypothetical protein